MITDLMELKLMRQQAGLTQSQLAKASGVSQSLIAKIESGRIDPAFTRVKQIGDALELLHKEKEKTIEEIMIRKVVSVGPESLMTDAIKKMKKFGISQMPVVDNGLSVGLISERTILESLTDGKEHTRVRDAMAEAPPQLPTSSCVSTASKLLSTYSLILAVSGGKIKGIVSRADILQKAFR